MPMLTRASTNPKATASEGTKLPSSPPRIVRSTAKQYTKMLPKKSITIWLERSRIKLRSRREVYWLAT